MEQNLSLDDVRLFLAVADAGGLAGAARATGRPVPTLARRMSALERRLSRRLFARGPRGYALTADGRQLLAAAEDLRGAAERLDRFSNLRQRPRVRITAGIWTTRFLARNIGRDWSPRDGWVPEFLASNAVIDIARRQADIGIRNRRPDQPWLAGRMTGNVRYAIYGVGPEVTGYVTLSDGLPLTPSLRWLNRVHGDEILTTASDTRVLMDMCRAGIARAILPTYVGDAEPGLQRIGAPIDEITHENWLVCHHEARHDPPIRAALETLAKLLQEI